MEKYTKHWKKAAVGLLIALLGLMGYLYHADRVGAYEQQLRGKEHLLSALSDEMRTTRESNGQLRHTKKTLQASVGELERHNHLLTDRQRRLVGQMKHNKNAFAGALVAMRLEVRGLRGKTTATSDTTLLLTHESDSLSYAIQVEGVRPTSAARHTLLRLDAPNEQAVAFQWGDRREGFPVSFTVTNSNPLFKVGDVDSYAIPEIQKQVLRPTLMARLRTNRKPFLIGVGVGAAAAAAIKLK
jgi:hypothetical protein